MIFHTYVYDLLSDQLELLAALNQPQQIIASHDQHEFLDEDIAERLFATSNNKNA